MEKRFFIHLMVALGLLSATFTYGLFLDGVKRIHPKRDLARFPYSFAGWHGSNSSISDWELTFLGVHDHMMRRYSKGDGADIWIYVGYYESQTETNMIHPPKNCLPASGWLPVSTSREVIDFTRGVARPIEVNRYLVQKGEEKDLVVYWYHSRGRVVASEYLNRVFLIWDSVVRGRSDGALVTVSCPASADDGQAWLYLVGFIREFFPILCEDFLHIDQGLERSS